MLNTWSGDPCLPRPYAYNWLTCNGGARPLISTITLTNKSLDGEISTSFDKFKSLIQLSLANTSLFGPIPDLSSLQYLEIFVTGNPSLCEENGEEYCKELSSSNSTTKNNRSLVAGVAATAAIAALIAIGIFIICITRQKRIFVFKNNSSRRQAITHQQIDHNESVLPHLDVHERSNKAHEFTFQAIKTMTRNFETVLGQGGFGLVYYGVLENGREVAVKLLAKDSRQGKQEFLNEVEFLCRVHHKTLVSLVGYCTESQLVLVYEFMANGSLCQALCGAGTKLVSWKDRLYIAVDAAEGLDYLHRGCNPSIIHRDVKSSNILLNDQFEGKISDFGISKAKQYSYTMEEGSQTITAVQGSFGYLDPAYAETNIANHSIDVYAFGVVLFELITGKPQVIKQMTRGEDPQHILQWAQPLIQQGDISHLVDPRLYQDFDISSMWKVIDVAIMCVEHDRRKRPAMSEIMFELKSALSMELRNTMYDTTSSNQYAALDYITDVSAR